MSQVAENSNFLLKLSGVFLFPFFFFCHYDYILSFINYHLNLVLISRSYYPHKMSSETNFIKIGIICYLVKLTYKTVWACCLCGTEKRVNVCLNSVFVMAIWFAFSFLKYILIVHFLKKMIHFDFLFWYFVSFTFSVSLMTAYIDES